MSAIGALAGAAVSGLWRAAAIGLVCVLLAVTGGAGAALWFSDRALTKAQADLDEVRGRAADYQAGIREQNRATEVLAREKVAADTRRAAAEQQAAAAGQRYDAALQQLAGARVTTCADAMPFVNKLLEDVR